MALGGRWYWVVLSDTLSSVQNLPEAEFIVATFMYMRLLGYPASSITILTTYNGQKHLIRDVVKQRCSSNPFIGSPHKVSSRRFHFSFHRVSARLLIFSLTKKSPETDSSTFCAGHNRGQVSRTTKRLHSPVIGQNQECWSH